MVNHYNKSANYIEQGLNELKNIPCSCTDDDYCLRCCLVDDVRNILHDIRKQIIY